MGAGRWDRVIREQIGTRETVANTIKTWITPKTCSLKHPYFPCMTEKAVHHATGTGINASHNHSSTAAKVSPALCLPPRLRYQNRPDHTTTMHTDIYHLPDTPTPARTQRGQHQHERLMQGAEKTGIRKQLQERKGVRSSRSVMDYETTQRRNTRHRAWTPGPHQKEGLGTIFIGLLACWGFRI